MAKQPRGVERRYAVEDVVAKLRRLDDALQSGKPFVSSCGRIRVPAQAEFSVELERDGEEIEFGWKWSADDENGDDTAAWKDRPDVGRTYLRGSSTVELLAGAQLHCSGRPSLAT